jgi:hypothetical protein
LIGVDVDKSLKVENTPYRKGTHLSLLASKPKFLRSAGAIFFTFSIRAGIFPFLAISN